jgi:hypothetical protein
MATELVVSISRDLAGDLELPGSAADDAPTAIERVKRLIEAGMSGTKTLSTMKVRDAATAATGTITLASCLANTVIKVNGVYFSAITGTGVVANNSFKIGVTDTADAAALAAAINASTSTAIAGIVTATSALGVVTLTAVDKGYSSNALTIETMGVVATQTVTYVAPSGTQTVVINGVTVYNATAGATATLTAAAAAAAINASSNALVAGHVRALSTAGVVTIYALYTGLRGNSVTTSGTGTGATVGGARLAGGTVSSSTGVQASGTFTCASGSGTMTAIINGVSVAISHGASDAADGIALAAAINSSTNALVRGHVTAADDGAGIVTVTAVHGGISGNTITTSATGTGLSAGQVRLTSGAVPTTAAFSGARLSGASDGGQVSYTF